MGDKTWITFVLTCFLVFEFCSHLVESSSSSRTVFEACLASRQRFAGLVTDKDDLRFCRLQMRRYRLTKGVAPSDITTWDANADANNLSLQYFKGLGMWKNGDADIGSALLDKVAPCWKRAQSQKNKWSSIYHDRREHDAVIFKVLDQTWQGENGTASFAAPDRSFDMKNLKAGELLIQRMTSADIGERFGRYSTTVYMAKTNTDRKRLHADRQASCWSNRGDTMALELNTELIKDSWVTEPLHPLQLEIRVQTRRQYLLTDRSRRDHKIPVVRQVIGMALYFTPSEEDVSSHLLSAIGAGSPVVKEQSSNNENVAAGDFFSSPLLGALLKRSKRGVAQSRSPRFANTRPPPTAQTRRRHDRQRPRHCYRTSYRLDRDAYDRMNIEHPEYSHPLFDIGECVGDCPFPLSSPNLNATNHAVVMSLGSITDESLTVCCIPVSYKNLSYTYSKNRYLLQKRLKNFVAASCACR